MIKELKEKFENNELMRFSERYSVISDYYSKDGVLLETANNAYVQNIQIVYDVISISNDDGSKHSMLISDFKTTKFSNIIETVDVNDISKILEKIIQSKITKVNVVLNGPSDSITLASNVLLKIFNYFKIINIDIGNLGLNKLELPNGEFKLVGFSISGGVTIVPQKFIMDVKNELNVLNTSIVCNVSDAPLIQLIGKNVNLDKLNFTQPVKLIIGSSKQDTVDKFKETSVNLSYINFDLSSFTDRDTSTSNGVYVDPIINIESNANTQLFNIEMIGGDFRKFIKVSGIKDFSISDFKRTSKVINAYSIGLDSIRSTQIKNINVYGEIVSKLDTCLIAFNSSSVTVSDTININSINLNNCGLIHLDSLTMKEILVYGCTFVGNLFLTSKNSNVSKLSFMNTNLTIDSDLSIEGNTIEFLNSYIVSDKSDISILSKENIKISNTKIICDKNDLIMKLEDSCSASIKNSDIYSKNYLIDKNEEDISPLVNFMESTSVKRIKFDNTNVRLNGKFSINNVDTQTYDGLRFSNASEINISNSSLLSSKLFALDVNKTIPLKFNKVSFKNASFVSATSPEKIPILISDSSGDLSFNVSDSYNNDETLHCDIEFTSVRSKLGCTFGSSLMNTRVKVTSSDSLGSCFFGGNNVSIVPEMISKDIEHFERTDKFSKKYDVVSYGNS